MSELVNSDSFCFKGSRRYVHGTDIFDRILSLNLPYTLQSIDLSFHKIAKSNLHIYLASDHIDKSKVNFVAKCLLSNREIEFYGVENGTKVDCNYEYDEELICENIEVDKANLSATMEKDLSLYKTIEKVVAINKYLLQNSFPDLLGKWYFTRITLKENVEAFVENVKPISLQFVKSFNNSLFKSEIYFGDNLSGIIFFSLVN